MLVAFGASLFTPRFGCGDLSCSVVGHGVHHENLATGESKWTVKVMNNHAQFPEGGMVSITESGEPVVVFLGSLPRKEAVDRAYMLLTSAVGFDEAEERLRSVAIGTPGSNVNAMLLAPLHIRVSNMWGTDLGDGVFLDYDYGDFEVTAVNLVGIVEADEPESGGIALR